jgi:hypothetical protein
MDLSHTVAPGGGRGKELTNTYDSPAARDWSGHSADPMFLLFDIRAKKNNTLIGNAKFDRWH